MKRTIVLTLLALTSVLALSQSARAETIILFNEERRASVNGSGTFYGEPGPWSYSQSGTNASGSASIALDTTLSADFLGGTALATAQQIQGFQNVGAGMQLFVDFTLSQSFTADLAALLSATGNGYAVVELFQFGQGTLVRELLENETKQVNYGAILSPGVYRFSLEAQAPVTLVRNSADASFNGGLTLTPIGPTPVPEPASMLLLGSGLVAIAAKRYRRGKRDVD